MSRSLRQPLLTLREIAASEGHVRPLYRRGWRWIPATGIHLRARFRQGQRLLTRLFFIAIDVTAKD